MSRAGSNRPAALRRSLLRRWTYDVTRVMARLSAVVLFRIRCDGRQFLPAEGGGLVCANHQSYLDPVLVGLTCDRRLNYLARETLFRFAPFRWLIQWYDAIPIQRDGLGIAGIKETLRRVKRGELVLVFPEGTRTPDGELLPLQPGFCALARRGRVPLVPIGIDGAFDAWPRRRRLPRTATIRICMGPPIAVEMMTRMTDEQLIEELSGRIRRCHEAARLGRNRTLTAQRTR